MRRCARARRGGAEDRLDLHLVDLGVEDPQAHAARAEHRVDLLQRRGAVAPAGPRAARRGAGRNSCSGGSSRRIVTGRPVHRLEDALEVRPAAAGAAASRRLRRCARRRRPGSRRPSAAGVSPRNMCSVRHRPMPSAPNSRALRASSGVSALVRTPRRRSSSAHSRTRLEARASTSGSTSGTSSVVIAPVVPSIAIASPSRSTVPSTRDLAARRASISSAPAPVTAGHAHPARDERRVRGLAALGGQDAAAPRGSPATSSASVNGRTRITSRRPRAAATASSAVKTISPFGGARRGGDAAWPAPS